MLVINVERKEGERGGRGEKMEGGGTERKGGGTERGNEREDRRGKGMGER